MHLDTIFSRLFKSFIQFISRLFKETQINDSSGRNIETVYTLRNL